MKTLITTVLLAVCALLAGCQLEEERSVADALSGTRPDNNWTSIECDKAIDGKRQCVVKFEWWDGSSSKVKVQVDSTGFPDGSYEASWTWKQNRGGYWEPGFKTSVDLKQWRQEEIVPWVVSQNRLIGARAEIVAKDELAAGRKRQAVWQSYRRD